MSLSLYIHIPFCTYKCPYCHFYVVQDKEQLKDRLLHSLLKEIDYWKEKAFTENTELVSLYFGGGTPTLFGAQRIAQLIERVQPNAACEVTIEANPETLSYELAKELYTSGVNRISIGVQ